MKTIKTCSATGHAAPLSEFHLIRKAGSPTDASNRQPYCKAHLGDYVRVVRQGRLGGPGVVREARRILGWPEPHTSNGKDVDMNIHSTLSAPPTQPRRKGSATEGAYRKAVKAWFDQMVAWATSRGATALPTTQVAFDRTVADVFLEHNPERNRKHRFDAKWVNNLARQMMLDLWDGRNGETIKVTSIYELSDGQNRMHAVVKARAHVSMLVVWNVSPDGIVSTDWNKPRSITSQLGIVGRDDEKALSKVVAHHMRVEGGPPYARVRVSPAETMQWIDANPDVKNPLVLDAVRLNKRTHGRIKMTCTAAAPGDAAFTILTKSAHPERLEYFLNMMMPDAPLPKIAKGRDGPIKTLVDALLTRQDLETVKYTMPDGSITRTRVSSADYSIYVYGTIIKTWNLWIDGRRGGCKPIDVIWTRFDPLPTPK